MWDEGPARCVSKSPPVDSEANGLRMYFGLEQISDQNGLNIPLSLTKRQTVIFLTIDRQPPFLKSICLENFQLKILNLFES